jgi:bifunctional UDP-N-acetylglucosamine pyrophosphorylase / glucosamine-1-phosphate N-acetyltransferase
MAEPVTVVIMAAGHGTRMRSSLPKVLHPVCGRPMLEWVIAAARDAGADEVVCVTRPGEGVTDAVPAGVRAVEQVEGEGTGSAVLSARDSLAAGGTAIVLSGDHPLISAELVRDLAAARAGDVAAVLLTTEELDPEGYGRVVRAPDGSVDRIVETKNVEGVPAEVLAIREINIGSYAFDAAELLSALDEVGETDGERYLTGVFPLLRARGRRIVSVRTDDTRSAMGVNTPADLMAVERLARGQSSSASP